MKSLLYSTFALLILSAYPFSNARARASDEQAESAQGTDDEADGEATKSKGRARKGKKKKDRLKERSVGFFPSWGAPGFHWDWDPIVGLSYGDETLASGERLRSATSEYGLNLGVSGIALVPGNPGLSSGASIGHAFGQSLTTVQQPDNSVSSENLSYQRTWLALGSTFLFKFFKHQLTLGLGKKYYRPAKYSEIHSRRLGNDFGILILTWFSTHLSHTYLVGYTAKASEPFIVESDYWLNGRFTAQLLDFKLALGPGITRVTEFLDIESIRRQVGGQTEYVKVVSSLHLFWKLGMSAYLKYVYRASQDASTESSRVSLPEENLDQPSTLPMPEDSLNSTFFIGAHNVLGPLGLGFHHNLRILNISEKNGTKRERKESQGFGVSYQVAI